MHEDLRFQHRRKAGKSIVGLFVTGVAFRHDVRVVFGSGCRETPEKIDLRNYSNIATPLLGSANQPPPAAFLYASIAL